MKQIQPEIELTGLDYEYIAINLLKGGQKSPGLTLSPLPLVVFLFNYG